MFCTVFDRQFNENEFIQGATAAFKMILTAFAEGDHAQLKRLLSYELLQSFMQTIHDRTAAKETLEITVNDIHEVSILNVELAESIGFDHGAFSYHTNPHCA